jgi:hypothetical protein
MGISTAVAESSSGVTGYQLSMLEALKSEAMSLTNHFAAKRRVVFSGAEVGHLFQLFGVDSSKDVILHLSLMKVETMLNHPNSWPAQTIYTLTDWNTIGSTRRLF